MLVCAAVVLLLLYGIVIILSPPDCVYLCSFNTIVLVCVYGTMYDVLL